MAPLRFVNRIDVVEAPLAAVRAPLPDGPPRPQTRPRCASGPSRSQRRSHPIARLAGCQEVRAIQMHKFAPWLLRLFTVGASSRVGIAPNGKAPPLNGAHPLQAKPDGKAATSFMLCEQDPLSHASGRAQVFSTTAAPRFTVKLTSAPEMTPEPPLTVQRRKLRLRSLVRDDTDPPGFDGRGNRGFAGLGAADQDLRLDCVGDGDSARERPQQIQAVDQGKRDQRTRVAQDLGAFPLTPLPRALGRAPPCSRTW